MSTQAKATFEMKSWDEKTWEGQPAHGVSGAKLTRASVTNAFHGDVEGQSTLEYLMAYADDGSASFVGLERVVGKVGGRSGSFVLQHTGTFTGGTVKGSYSVVPGSGTGELRGLRGQGSTTLPGEAPEYPFPFEYDFE
jgi:hypothetical protein